MDAPGPKVSTQERLQELKAQLSSKSKKRTHEQMTAGDQKQEAMVCAASKVSSKRLRLDDGTIVTKPVPAEASKASSQVTNSELA